MTVDPQMIVAERRADELLAMLIRALNGEPRWRRDAATLVHEIERLVLPEPAHAALIKIDERKRAAEQMQDLVNAD